MGFRSKAARAKRASKSKTTKTSVSALERLRAQIGQKALTHLPGIGKLRFDDDYSRSDKYLLAGLRIGEHVELDAWGWAYCRIRVDKATFDVFLYDFEGDNEYLAETEEERDMYDPGKGLRMTRAAFEYEDEFMGCRDTHQIQTLALYFFLIHAEEEGKILEFPEVTISEGMVETMKVLCGRWRIENERDAEEERVEQEIAAKEKRVDEEKLGEKKEDRSRDPGERTVEEKDGALDLDDAEALRADNEGEEIDVERKKKDSEVKMTSKDRSRKKSPVNVEDYNQNLMAAREPAKNNRERHKVPHSRLSRTHRLPSQPTSGILDGPQETSAAIGFDQATSPRTSRFAEILYEKTKSVFLEHGDSDTSDALTERSNGLLPKAVRSRRRPSNATKQTKNVVSNSESSSGESQVPARRPPPW